MKLKLVVSTAVVALTAALSGSAHASVIPVLDTVTSNGSGFTFSYTGNLAPDQGVRAGDQLVIVDFAGYISGSVHSAIANVSASVSNTLPIGLLLNPGFIDDPTIADLVFTYNGPDFQTTGGPYPSLISFSGLSADSIYSGMKAGSFSAEAVKNAGFTQGTAAFNVGEVAVPSAVPEPATWAMLLLGFGAVGFMMRNARKTENLAASV